MMTSVTTAPTRPREHGRSWRVGLIDRWAAAWNHALAVYYRAKGGWFLTPRLGRAGMALVWGLFLAGTGLGVAAYPGATEVQCDWFTCHYRLLERMGGSPFEGFNHALGTFFLALTCAIVPAMLALALLWTFVQGLRGQLRTAPRGATLANTWHNGVIAMLVITPLGPEGLVRIRFLTRVYILWRHRALIATVLGVIAAVIVSQHVLRPIFWWLGPWLHWAMQLILVGLWCLVAAVWLVNLAAFATLQEVTFSPHRSAVGPNWRLVSVIMIVAMVITPVIVSRLYFSSFDRLSYHDENTLSVVSAPLILLALGPVFTALNYLAAQAVFQLRARHLPFGG